MATLAEKCSSRWVSRRTCVRECRSLLSARVICVIVCMDVCVRAFVWPLSVVARITTGLLGLPISTLLEVELTLGNFDTLLYMLLNVCIHELFVK